MDEGLGSNPEPPDSLWTPGDIPGPDEMQDFELRMIAFQGVVRIVAEKLVPMMSEAMKDSNDISKKIDWVLTQPPLVQIAHLRELVESMKAFEAKHSKFIYALKEALDK